ncbi:hypothetical protein PoB_000718400 [Plakobranchus ocellatus]|uniref:Uncharacterized protein n=1 Tax=Plakobranchus ocellatus TaxID=259542 RepID=A0AAV3YF39_9GAST|nr:hypothetical protein PoB_000718400 [Plakobranchus ocellatus]
MSDRSIQRKEDYLDWMHEKFCASSKAYVSAVKAALRSHRREHAAEIFERAIDVLSPDFPDPTSIAGQTQEEGGGDGNELNSLKDRITQVERQLQEVQNERSTLESELKSVRQEAQNERSFLESQLNSAMKKNFRLDAKIGGLKDTVVTLASETKDSIKELTEVLKENSANIQGLRKLQMLMKQRDQTAAAAAAAAAVTPPPTAPSASALSRPLKDVRQRKTFTACTSEDQDEHRIFDVQLLPGGRLLLADAVNDCVKLFDTQGQQHLHTLECRSGPHRLVVLDSSSIRHTVAVTLPFWSGIDILEVNGDNMEIKRTLQTSREYVAVAAVNNLTLAVGYWPDFGIDLIDLGGQVLRQICSSVRPFYMDITEDGYLMCSTWNRIARVQVDTGTVVFDKSACLQNGDLRLTGPPSGQGASGGARTRNKMVPADLWADSLSTVPPTPPIERCHTAK